MKLTCKTQDLMAGLNNATRALMPKPTTPQLEMLKIVASAGKIALTGTDGTLTISTEVDADIQRAGETLLPGRLLNEIVKKMPDGSLTMETDDKHVTVIKCKQIRSTLAGMPTDGFPVIADMEGMTALHVPQKPLKDLISRVVFAIAQHESRVTLTGCLLETTQDELRLVGIDGFRLAILKAKGRYAVTAADGPVKAIIPRHVMLELSRMMDNDNSEIALSIAKGRMMAVIGRTTMMTMLIAGEYINYRQILPQHWNTRVTVKCAELEAAIDRASLIAREGKNNLITIKIQGETMQVSARSDMGDTLDEIGVHLEGDPIEISFNARYIGEAMKNITDECCVLAMEGSISPCMISSGEADGDYAFMVLPVRTGA